MAQGNKPSGLREAADARVNLLVWEQEGGYGERLGRAAGCCPMLRRSFRTEEPLLAESLMLVPSPSPRIV